MNNDGSIDPSNYQLLDDWNSGIRNSDLVTLVYGYDLMNILSNELGLVDINDEGFLRSNIVITPRSKYFGYASSREIAEAMVVYECNKSTKANRLLGIYARKGKISHDTQRDVIWINKENKKNKLLQIAYNTNCAITAGIQLKVSMDGFKYIYKKDVARGI